MSSDPFIFTPPSLDDLNEAVEHAQKAAVIQAVGFLRENRRASPAEFAGASRNGRHITAMQRTLRTMGGPLFDPDSPLTPAQRNEILMRRIRRVETAYADPFNPPPRPLRCHTRKPASRHPSHNRNPASPDPSHSHTPQSPEDAPLGSPSACSASSPLPTLDADYCPPDIEDLLSLAELLAKAAAQRWRDIREGRVFLSPEDRQLEVLALRDITAIFRTLYRMSALAIAEDQTHKDLQKELEADLALEPVNGPFSGSPNAAAPFSPSTSPPSDFSSAPPPEGASPDPPTSPTSISSTQSTPSTEPTAAPSSYPSHRSHPSYPAAAEPDSPLDSDPSDSSDLSDLSDPSDSAHTSDASTQPSASPSADEELPLPATNPIPSQRPVRPIPPVPEIRPVAPSHRASSAPIPRSSSDSGSRKSKSHHAAIYQENDLGPWGNWDTPPPGAIDESSPEFLQDMKSHGYAEAHRRAAQRLRDTASPPGAPSSPILNDAEHPNPPPPDDTS